MNKAILIITLIFSSIVINAQNLTLQYPQITKEGPLVSYEESFYTVIYNNSNTSMNLRWVRTENNMPQGWVSKVCDDGLCYNENVSSANYNEIVAPGDSTYIVGYIVLDGINAGDAEVSIVIYDINDSLNSNVTFNFQYTSWPTGIDKTADKNAFNIYPVPANNILNIDLPANGVTTEIFDVMGRMVNKSAFEGNIEKGIINISELNHGSYFILVKDEQGLVLNKKSFIKL